MTGRRPRPPAGRNQDARKNHMLADAIDVGLIYWEVYGTKAARIYLTSSGVDARIVERVLTGFHRGWGLLR